MAFSKRSWPKLLLLIALLMGVFLCAEGIAAPVNSFRYEQPFDLKGLWSFKTGGEKTWAAPVFDDKSWQKIPVPGYWDEAGHKGYKGEAWYRTHFRLMMPPYERPIGLYLGGINDTDQVFLNGRLIGQTGRFEPQPQIMYGRERLYVIPAKSLNFNGENVLAVRIWHAKLFNHNVGGFASSEISFGDYEEYRSRMNLQDIWQLSTSLLILFIGLYHLPVYLRRRSAKENLFFFLLCLCVGIYGLMRSQLRFLFWDDFLLMKQFEYLPLFLTPLFGVEYAVHLFERKRPLFITFLGIASLSFVLIALAAWNLSVNTLLLTPFYFVTIIQMSYMIFLMFVESARNKPEAKVVAVGVSIFFLVGLNDIMIVLGFYRIDNAWLNAIDLIGTSFLAVIFCMALSLAIRSMRTHEDLEKNREELVRKGFRLTSILQVSQEMSSILNRDRLAEKIIAIAHDLTESDKGLVLVQNEKKESFEILAAKEILGEAWSKISDEFGTEIFDRFEVIQTIGAGKSLLCLPIKFQGEVKGACYLEKSTPFNEEDIAVLKSVMNQAAISSENAKLYELATTDGLTKLIGHRHFQFLLQQETERAIRFHRTLALLMLDIDHFKRLNDTYGHQAGDEVLIEVSRVLQQGCREIDTVARYGGEEFVLILPETDLAGAFLVAERLRSRVENCVICYQDQVMRVTVSLGVACFPEQAASKEELIQVADKAMYLSKERGRNRVSPPIFLK